MVGFVSLCEYVWDFFFPVLVCCDFLKDTKVQRVIIVCGEKQEENILFL